MDEADVVDRLGLVVEAAFAQEVVHLGLDPRVVGEDAGVLKADGRQRRGHVEFEAVDLAVADVGGRVQPARRRFLGHRVGQVDGVAVLDHLFPGVLHLFAGHTGVDDLDQVLHVAVEEVHADHALATEAVFEAEVQAIGGLRVQFRVADVVVVAELAIQQRRQQLVEVWALDGLGQRQADAVGIAQVPAQVHRRQQFVVVLADAAFAFVILEILDLGLGGLVTQAGFPRESVALAAEHDVRVQALFLDHRSHAAVQVVVRQGRRSLAFLLGLPLVRDEQAFTLLGAVVHAELQFGAAQRARMGQPEAGFGVLGGDGFGFINGFVPLRVRRDAPGVVPVLRTAHVNLLAFGGGLRVLEAGIVHTHGGPAAGHVERVLRADAVVLLVVRVAARHADVDGLVVVQFLFERHLGDIAIGLHVEAVDAEAAGVAHVRGVRQVGRVVAPVLDLGLVFPADLLFTRIVGEAVRALGLGAVAVLHVHAGQQAPAERFERGHGTEGRVDLAIVPAVHADADVAAGELVGVAQHDVDRAGHRIAAAVGAGAALDLDVVHHLRGDAVDIERTVVAGARHLLAVDQHLRIAAAQAAQLHAVVFHDVRADEAHARHALEHVAHGVGLEALEVFQVVDQGRRDVVGAVAVGDLGLHHHRVQLLGIACGARVRRLVLGGGSEAGRKQGSAEQRLRERGGQGIAFHVCRPRDESKRHFVSTSHGGHMTGRFPPDDR